jgi:hypothetical protein
MSTPLFHRSYARLVYSPDLGTIVPPEMGTPRVDQLQGTELDKLVELAGRVCYDGATELLTRAGWVRFPDLPRGVEVATFNATTGRMEYQIPTDYIEKPYTGPMYTARNTKVSIRVTSDHELFVRPSLKSPWSFVRAADAEGTRYAVRRCAIYEGEPAEGIYLPGRVVAAGSLARKSGQLTTCQRVTQGFTVSRARIGEWAALLGYFLSEGSISGKRRVVIYQRPDRALDEIRACIANLGIRHREWTDRRNGVVRVMIGNSVLARHLSQFGRTAARKHLPREVFSWPLHVRSRLLDAIMAGDGHRRAGGARVYSTRSRRLADDVQQLIIMSGRVGTISYTTAGEMYRVTESMHDLHTVNKHEKQDRMSEDSDEIVYCVTVPNRVLFTRREDKVVLCANCYDSCGTGRSSADYHAHIREVGHFSVLAHANIDVWVRPGEIISRDWSVFLRDNVRYNPVTERLTINFRHAVAWEEEATGYAALLLRMDASPTSGVMGWWGDLFRVSARRHATLAFPPETESESSWRLLASTRPDPSPSAWVSLYMTGSRGFSHEMVRHHADCAVSQRSTRYVDEAPEDKSCDVCVHPLRREYVVARKDVASPDEPSVTSVTSQVYRDECDELQYFLSSKGVDNLSARKQARGAARLQLPNGLRTDMIFSASVEQWKYMLKMRGSKHADAEIREVFVGDGTPDYPSVLSALRDTEFRNQFDAEVAAIRPSPDGIGVCLDGV